MTTLPFWFKEECGMKRLSMGIAVLAAFACAGTAWGQAVNTICPVKGQAAKPGIKATYKGKTIIFC